MLYCAVLLYCTAAEQKKLKEGKERAALAGFRQLLEDVVALERHIRRQERADEAARRADEAAARRAAREEGEEDDGDDGGGKPCAAACSKRRGKGGS